jgi:hypothetical protein
MDEKEIALLEAILIDTQKEMEKIKNRRM